MNKKIILASSSRYRQEQLGRLQLAFFIEAPQVDETPREGESGAALALRLASEKAQEVARRCTDDDTVVIGADQVAELDDGAREHSLGKPGSRDNARLQLRSIRGRRVTFHSAIAVYDTKTAKLQVANIPTVVTMREYTDAQIEHYLDHEDALDCAGSAKSEGLGVALIAGMHSDDPTALVGLPLIALTGMLLAVGVDVLGAAAQHE